jgi:hypothetical protein
VKVFTGAIVVSGWWGAACVEAGQQRVLPEAVSPSAELRGELAAAPPNPHIAPDGHEALPGWRVAG